MGRARSLATRILSALIFVAATSSPRDVMLAPIALAQNIGMRTVRGTVLNAASQPVSGSTVFLKNTRTKTIRSYSSTADGHYYFAQVDMSVDFDLWAEKDEKKSAVKTVSSWDARKDFIADLKLK
jgi:carboxypeptidase family protein